MCAFADLDESLLAAVLADARVWPGADQSALVLPFYRRADFNRLALAAVSPSGVFTAGDTAFSFTLMSAVKPLLLLHLLHTIGPEAVFGLVGVLPSDDTFYSVEQLLADERRPRNPMLNSGAMLLADQLSGRSPAEQCDRFLEWLNLTAGTSFALCPRTFNYMMSPGDDDNHRLAGELAVAGLTNDADRMIDVYCRLCCLAGTIADAARLGQIIARPHPDLNPAHQSFTAAIMSTCGLYQESAEWAAFTGIPAKSGVSGVVIAAVPGQGGLAAFSPRLAPGGNSVLARRMLSRLAASLRLGVFDPR